MASNILLYKQSLKSDEHMVIATPIDYKPESQRILVSVNNKVEEAIYNPKTGNVTAKLIAPQTKTNHPLAVQLPQNPAMRVKFFVYDFLQNKILNAKLQEFEYNPVTFEYEKSDELLTTSPVIMGDWQKFEVKNDFFIDFKMHKSEENTFVPFGIPSFDRKLENSFFAFDYTLKTSDIDEFSFQIYDNENVLIFSENYIKEVVIKSKAIKKIKFGEKDKKTTQKPAIINNDVLKNDFTKVGTHIIFWDGFNNDGILDTALLNGKTFKAKIIAQKGNIKKSKELFFSTQYSAVNWVDVKINNNTKIIDITLRVNLQDGGSNGLECKTYNAGNSLSSEGFSSSQTDPFENVNVKICDWDKIPQKTLKYFKKEPIKKRTKSFEDLKQMALKGLKTYWSRNKNHQIAKGINIYDVLYEVNIFPINSEENSINKIDLVFNTNSSWVRSGNPGVLARLSYNVGYIEYSNGWSYQTYKNEDIEFQETAAHEIGHTILSAFGGEIYSWQHKGSSYLLNQDKKATTDNSLFKILYERTTHIDLLPKKNGEYYPKNGEIDLMKYYNFRNPDGKIVSGPDSKRTIASEIDVHGLLWLTKIRQI